MLIYLIYGYVPNIYYIQAAYYYLCEVTLLMGLTWAVSALAVFSKDILNMTALVTQVGFWATPLVWDPSGMPQSVQMVVKLNPMYYVCVGYRETFSGHAWFFEHPALTLYFWMFTAVLLSAGAYIFYKLRPQFADML